MDRTCIKFIAVLLCLFALPVKAEPVEFGWYFPSPLVANSNTFNFLDVTAADYSEGREHLSFAGMIGSTVAMRGMPVNAGCMTGYEKEIRIYDCIMTTGVGSFKVTILATGPDAGDGTISLLDASGNVVAGKTTKMVLAHSQAVE